MATPPFLVVASLAILVATGLLVALFIACLILMAWQLANVLLLGFGSVLVAVPLRNLARLR